MKQFFYIEADGGVFTVQKDGKVCFPSSRDEVPFRFCVDGAFEVDDSTVYFCSPVGFTFDEKWPFKEDLVCQDGVDSLVRKSIVVTFPRLYAGALVQRKNSAEFLLVKNARGFAKGVWTLPGGFVKYGESPNVSVVRETKEETGLEVRADHLLGVYSKCCGVSGFFSHGFAYYCVQTSGSLHAKEGEIEEAKFMLLDDVLCKVNGFSRFAINKFVYLSLDGLL